MAEFEFKERHKEWAIQGAVATACIVVAFLVLIKPVLEEGRDLRENIRTSQKRLELYKNIASLTAKQKSLEESLSDFEDRPLLTGRISDIANKEKIDVQGVTPKTEAVGKYERFTLEMDLKSSYSRLLNCLKIIENMSPTFNVKDISITRRKNVAEGKGASQPLQCKLILETFLKQKPGKT